MRLSYLPVLRNTLTRPLVTQVGGLAMRVGCYRRTAMGFLGWCPPSVCLASAQGRHGHNMALFAAPGSHAAMRRPLLGLHNL